MQILNSKTREKHMMRRVFVLMSLLTTAGPIAGSVAEAQQTERVPQVGFLVASTPSNYVARLDTFRQGLRELGYVEGKNINIEYRFAEGK
jgi:putative ABC transport system substrate-binding protein